MNAMTKQEFLTYCLRAFGTTPDYPFDDWIHWRQLSLDLQEIADCGDYKIVYDVDAVA